MVNSYLKDENPSPTCVTCHSLHLTDAEGQNTGACGCERADNVENGIALLKFVSDIPGAITVLDGTQDILSKFFFLT